MNTLIKTIPFLLLFIFSINHSIAQGNYEVELAAFNRPVSLNYFNGMQGISYYVDANNIHRYRVKNLTSEQEAKKTVAEAKSKGINARLVDLEKEREALALCQEKIDHLFFDFDQSQLSRQAKKELDELASVLRTNPDYVAVLAGHTDNKGDDNYNDMLSKARVESAKAYLVSKNISSKQISIQSFGENWPIAKNTTGSRDLPKGRKFNRRVEIQIVNSSAGQTLMPNLVNSISVPSELKY